MPISVLSVLSPHSYQFLAFSIQIDIICTKTCYIQIYKNLPSTYSRTDKHLQIIYLPIYMYRYVCFCYHILVLICAVGVCGACGGLIVTLVWFTPTQNCIFHFCGLKRIKVV